MIQLESLTFNLSSKIFRLSKNLIRLYLSLNHIKPITIDLGVSHYMINDASLINNVKPASRNVIIVNGHDVYVKKKLGKIV